MRKILITGGTGFIGKFLVNKLLKETEDELHVVDNTSSSSLPTHYVDNPRISFYHSDLTDWQPPVGIKFDQIYHLAGPVGPVRVLEYAGRIAQAIVSHLYKMADMAIDMDAKLIFISTSEVYGTDAKEATPEHQHSVIPSKTTVRLEYGVAKLMGEIILKNLSTVSSLKYNCIRPFNIVGPGQNGKGGFVIPRFIALALEGKPITVYGKGEMVRTFTHVDDFVDAIVSVMNSDVSGEVFNVGHPENTIKIRKLAEKIKQNLNSPSEIVFVDPKELFGSSFEEAWDKIPDVSKITSMVGWKPKKSMRAIINELTENIKTKSPEQEQDFSI